MPAHRYQTEPREDEAFALNKQVSSLPEYVQSSQGHRLSENSGIEDVAGVWLKDKASTFGRYALYRDPINGGIYKVRKDNL